MPKSHYERLAHIREVLDAVLRSQPVVELPEQPPAPRAEAEARDEPARRAAATFLIAGLGNPGREYANNRHNVGFMVLDRLADRLGVQFTRLQHRALVTDTRFRDHKLILIKPQTYMNESGQAVAALAKFYKIDLENLLVVFDDMDLPLGALRIRPKGGSGGQKGMKSIIQRLGKQQNFPRLRIGIGRPPGQMPPPAYLLQDFSYDEQTRLAPVLDTAVDAILTFVTDGLEMAMNRYNGMVGE